MKWLNLTTGNSNHFNKVQKLKKWFTYIHAQIIMEQEMYITLPPEYSPGGPFLIQKKTSGWTVVNMNNGPGEPNLI